MGNFFDDFVTGFQKSSAGLEGLNQKKLLSASGVCSLIESTKSLQKPD